MADGSSRFIDFGQELVVDLFAGGGGASLGIERAYRAPDVAVNHNPVAIGVHALNHPGTEHYTCDVFEVDPVVATKGRPVGVLWASPDCRHHSKAKGGKPRSKKIRGLAWVVTKWAAAIRPRLIHLENVEEFADWGPLLKDGSPCKLRKGMTFRRWVRQLENLGYVVEHRELVAADYGTPTIRKRLYVIARCDSRPIVWPKPTHAKDGKNGLLPWRAAAECIDFSRAANSIFGRKKRLAVNTERRIAKGLWRYVLNTPRPFIVRTDMHQSNAGCVYDINDPLRTITSSGGHAVVEPVLTPFLTEHANSSTQRTFDVAEPLRTQCAQVKGGHFSTVAASLVKLRRNCNGADVAAPLGTITAGAEHHGLVGANLITIGYGEREGQAARAQDLAVPLGTVVAANKHALVAAHVTHLTHQGDRSGNDVSEPLRTVTGAHRGEQAVVAAFLEQANTGQQGRALRAPMSTICASGSHQQLVSAYLVKYYRDAGQAQDLTHPLHTVSTKDRMGLVEVVHVAADTLAPELRDRAKAVADFLHEYLPEHFPEPADMVLLGAYVLVDVTLRMLAPRELAMAQGFPADYVLDRTADGKPVTKTDQVRLIGNSVCPDVAEALIRANAADLIQLYAVAA